MKKECMTSARKERLLTMLIHTHLDNINEMMEEMQHAFLINTPISRIECQSVINEIIRKRILRIRRQLFLTIESDIFRKRFPEIKAYDSIRASQMQRAVFFMSDFQVDISMIAKILLSSEHSIRTIRAGRKSK